MAVALRIYFRVVLFIALAVTLTFRLPGRINFIVTDEGVRLFRTLDIFSADFKALSRPVSNYSVVFFFSIILSLAESGRSNGIVFLPPSLIKDSSGTLLEVLLPVNRSKRMFLKIPNCTKLLAKANFLISSDWFFAQTFSQAFSCLFRSFFFVLAAFFI